MIPEKALRFTSPQRGMVFQALNEAEERIAGYYCIPPFQWEKLRYDLLTREDHGWEPLPNLMLARVRCLQRVNPIKPFHFYRIELDDDSILSAAEREDLLNDKYLYPFFVYILTHEVVHMVRLNSILEHGPDTIAPVDESEEERVRGISRRILGGSSKYVPVLDRFCNENLIPPGA
jgi:hypothetical protein